MTIAVNPRTDPTDRSMFRDTMISTIPVVMTATAADWTERFQRKRGVRNRPSERKLNTTHRTTNAMTMPSSRTSNPTPDNEDRRDRAPGSLLRWVSTRPASVVTVPPSVEGDWK